MYSVEEILKMGGESSVKQMWNGHIACLLVKSHEIAIGPLLEGVSAFAFVLVNRGSLTVRYDGQKLVLNPNDIHTYAPGMLTEMVHVSDDYEGFLIMIEKQFVENTHLMGNIIKAAYFPIAEFSKPRITLNDEQAEYMRSLLLILRQHIVKPVDYQHEALLALLEVFSIDLLNIQNIMVENHRVSSRFENIFASFIQLVPRHFIKHHDLQFYADQLNISTPYLSRIVREMSGQTVMSFIDYALASESARRLKMTDQSVTDMSYDLGFSDQAAFTKFFKRMKGMSPREFRKK